jgi:anti-anti-sigma factor
MPSPEPTRPSAAKMYRAEQLAVEARTQRRTALVALRGELDLVTVSKVAEVIDGLELEADGVRHVVLDLRGLTFMDLVGLRELLRQNEYARAHRHNLAVVRGTDAIQRVLELTDVEEQLVLVDDPEDLVPPPSPADAAPPTPEAAPFDITLTRTAGTSDPDARGRAGHCDHAPAERVPVDARANPSRSHRHRPSPADLLGLNRRQGAGRSRQLRPA